MIFADFKIVIVISIVIYREIKKVLDIYQIGVYTPIITIN